MKNKILLLFSFFVVYQSISAQSAFSYKRQLNYQQCKKCDCKKSRSYKIISTNLTSTQLVCAQEDNRANLTVKEMFQNGTSGGLFGGFNPPQEGCGNDCYHEFVNASDEVETVKIDECLTESQRQKINQQKDYEQNNKEDEETRIASERIKLKEFIEKKDQEIYVLRKEALNLANINDLKACLIIQEKVCAESAELTILCEKNNFSYSGNLSDVNDYAFYLILNKEYDKALNKLNEFFNMDYGKFTSEETKIFYKALWYSSANGENIGRLMCVNFTNALLLSNKNEKLHKTLIYLEFDSKLEGGTRTKWMKMILEGYRLLEGRGIEIPDVRNLKFGLKLRSWDWDDLNVTISTNSKGSLKNYLQSKNSLREFARNELYSNTHQIKKMDENIYRILCYNSKNVYYYLDFNGSPIIVFDCPSEVSSKKETKIVATAKKIRAKDLGVASLKK